MTEYKKETGNVVELRRLPEAARSVAPLVGKNDGEAQGGISIAKVRIRQTPAGEITTLVLSDGQEINNFAAMAMESCVDQRIISTRVDGIIIGKVEIEVIRENG